MNSPSNRFAGEINKTPYRMSNSPIQFPPLSNYDDEQENTYVNAAPRLSDSDSSSELPYQRMFTQNQSMETRNNKNQGRMFASSGGFAIPTTPPVLSLSMSDDKTPSASPRISQQNPFLPCDETEPPQSTDGLDSPTNSSTSYSPVPVRTAPFYVSVYTSSPPTPLIKNTIATSAPPASSSNTDDDSFFTRRSPSPQPPLMLKKLERTNAFDYQQK